jgi:3-oxoacyl-[acyl-carrier-protein] synthase II
MSTYINAISSISFQDFLEIDSILNLKKLTAESELIQPIYKQWIKPMQLRRMSKIIRMGIGCSKDIINKTGVEIFEAIIVGTGLGCIKDTVKFMDTINAVSTSSIPPTAFIQSTHNTMAGQIALQLSNNNYNMTYVQNGVSFEHALLDGHIKIMEGQNNILVGALDEMVDYLQALATLANIKNPSTYTEGSAFFNLVKEKDDKTYAELVKTMTFTCGDNFSLENTINKFLKSEGITLDDIDLTFNTSPKFNTTDKHSIETKNQVFFEDYCGKYFTSSAFGMYLASLCFKEKISDINSVFGTNIKKVNYSLIINNYMDKVVGLTLLKRA